jgi:hypothetical protein
MLLALPHERLREFNLCSALDGDYGIDTHLKQYKVVLPMIQFIIRRIRGGHMPRTV